MEQKSSVIDHRRFIPNQISLQITVCSSYDDLTIVDENVKKALEEKIRKLKSEVDALNVEINAQWTEERALRTRLTDIDTEKVQLALSS